MAYHGRGMKAGEGWVDVTDGRVWYEVVGSGDATPLLVLHGGPGSRMCHLEERERYNEVLREFLREVEGERVR
jgi:hypothetical protein